MNSCFCEISPYEMMEIDGGKKGGFGSALIGTAVLSFSPFGFVIGGITLGGAMVSFGCNALNYACN